MTERNPVIDFRRLDQPRAELPDLDFNPDASLVAYIGARLPNVQLQKQLDDNEHQIQRWVEAWS